MSQRRSVPIVVLVAAALYAVCAVFGLLSVFWRRFGWLTDHAGNVAVCGFIMAAAFPGALLQRIGQRRGNPLILRLGRSVLPVAAGAWGLFFVLMEIWPLYARNVRDLGDIPGSVIGTVCGFVLGSHFESQLVGAQSGVRAHGVRQRPRAADPDVTASPARSSPARRDAPSAARGAREPDRSPPP